MSVCRRACLSLWKARDGRGGEGGLTEAEHFVSHALEDGERLLRLEVLELDEAVGPLVLDGHAELLHCRHVLLSIQPRFFVPLPCARTSEFCLPCATYF